MNQESNDLCKLSPQVHNTFHHKMVGIEPTIERWIEVATQGPHVNSSPGYSDEPRTRAAGSYWSPSFDTRFFTDGVNNQGSHTQVYYLGGGGRQAPSPLSSARPPVEPPLNSLAVGS